MQTLHALEWA